MIPWWAGFLLFVGGMVVGMLIVMLIVMLNDSEDEPTFKCKYIKK